MIRFKKLDFSHEGWLTTFRLNDKVGHFFGSVLLTIFYGYFVLPLLAAILGFIFGALWEIKDGMIYGETWIPFIHKTPYEFSWKDLVADFGGCVLGGLWLKLLTL